MKKLIKYIRSLGWSKEDIKKILMLIIMLLITCFILNKFLRVRIYGDIDINNYNGTDFSVSVSGYPPLS
jgi:hypothetical protein